MKITTTEGREYYIAENCPYCYLNTAGQHAGNCPMRGLSIIAPREYYQDIIARRKREVDAHPEWGISYLWDGDWVRPHPLGKNDR